MTIVDHTIANSAKVCEHFHLPVQAGSNAVLEDGDIAGKLFWFGNQGPPVCAECFHYHIIVGFPESRRTFSYLGSGGKGAF